MCSVIYRTVEIARAEFKFERFDIEIPSMIQSGVLRYNDAICMRIPEKIFHLRSAFECTSRIDLMMFKKIEVIKRLIL